MTRPTRAQVEGFERLVEALVAVTEAARLDGRVKFGPDALNDLAGVLARATSAFSLDELVVRALERRGRSLGLRAGTGELLVLIEGDQPPLELLLLDDDAFRARAEAAEEELGGPE